PPPLYSLSLHYALPIYHDRQSVRGFEVILYVFPRGDGPFSMTHLVPPACSSAQGCSASSMSHKKSGSWPIARSRGGQDESWKTEDRKSTRLNSSHVAIS